MKTIRPHFSLRTAFVLISVCALTFWIYGQVTPLWNQYQQLRAAINRSSDMSLIEVGEVVVNLNSPTQTRFASVGVYIQVAPEDDIIAAKSIEDNEAALRDELIRNLRSKSIGDLQNSKDMDQFREEVTERFEEILFPKHRVAVQKVIFDKFLIQ